MSFCQDPPLDCQYLKNVLRNINNRIHTLETTAPIIKTNKEVNDKINEDFQIPRLNLNKIETSVIENNIPHKKVLVTFGNKENFRIENSDGISNKLEKQIHNVIQKSPKQKQNLQNFIQVKENQHKIKNNVENEQKQILVTFQKEEDQDCIQQDNKQPKLKLIHQDSNLKKPLFSKKNSYDTNNYVSQQYYTRNNSIQSTPVKQIAFNSSLGTSPLRKKNSQLNNNNEICVQLQMSDEVFQAQSKFQRYFQQNYGYKKKQLKQDFDIEFKIIQEQQKYYSNKFSISNKISQKELIVK